MRRNPYRHWLDDLSCYPRFQEPPAVIELLPARRPKKVWTPEQQSFIDDLLSIPLSA